MLLSTKGYYSMSPYDDGYVSFIRFHLHTPLLITQAPVCPLACPLPRHLNPLLLLSLFFCTTFIYLLKYHIVLCFFFVSTQMFCLAVILVFPSTSVCYCDMVTYLLPHHLCPPVPLKKFKLIKSNNSKGVSF